VHREYDLRTSIQIAQAVESIKPLWLEDPLPVEYSESWKRLVASSNVPICTGLGTCTFKMSANRAVEQILQAYLAA